MSQTDWSAIEMSEFLPTGTVTLLLADVERSTQLWESRPEEMATAMAALNTTATALITVHNGARPVEQGEGDSFVAAFSRGSDAVACALALQRADLAPIRLRIGVHTGEIQVRDDGNYAGSTINRTARLRDLAHGGQTVMSGATEYLVLDRLPDGAWLAELGTHPLRDLPRPERVVQLCHPDVRTDFPPLRVTKNVAHHNLPRQLTRFVGRAGSISDLRRTTEENRLVTLTGAGGVGKTRLAIQLADRVSDDYIDGVWYVDLAPVTEPGAVPLAAARAMKLFDQPGRSTTDTLVRHVADKTTLLVLDNCEHLLDAVADLVQAIVPRCPGVALLTTSREPIGVDGEVTWRVPSLRLADEAIELFDDRARRARSDFVITAETVSIVTEICRRLDGIPLAIELAAARTRALSLNEILDSLHDRFRLLTGGSRTAVRRQQTLRASVDWSHALLTEPERVLFRRLAVFIGGFDLQAVRAVTVADEVERFQVFDVLSLLVDKSLVAAEERRGRTRYRLLETVRQYASEKLGESGEADAVRNRHRDHFVEMSAALDTPTTPASHALMKHVENNIDNLTAAFAWSLENGDHEVAVRLATSLYPIWVSRGRLLEGINWLDAAMAGADDIPPAVRVRALTDLAMFVEQAKEPSRPAAATEALKSARDLDDPPLLLRALVAAGSAAAVAPTAATAHLLEAADLARKTGDRVRLGEILAWQQQAAFYAGDPRAARRAADEGIAVAAEIGNRFIERACRWGGAWAAMVLGELTAAAAQLADIAAEAETAGEPIWRLSGLGHLIEAQAHLGDYDACRDTVDALMDVGAELGGSLLGLRHGFAAFAALAEGELGHAQSEDERARRSITSDNQHLTVNLSRMATTALAIGNLEEARCLADRSVNATTGWHRMVALTTRACVAIALDQLESAEQDLNDALSIATETDALLTVPDILDRLAVVNGNPLQAVRLLGAAESIRRRTGEVRLAVHQPTFSATVETLRETLDEATFERAWAEGAAMTTDEAIAYAQRGRRERRRSSSGWSALTAAELEVVRLVGDGLANKEIATRLFLSPRTVESHLSHVYTKLGMSSRVQLAQEASRRLTST